MARELGFAGRFNIVFAGNMGLAQALGPVIEAARRVRNRAPDVLFTFMGGGVEVERLKQSARDLPNVQFMEPRPMSEVGAVLSNANALLVHLKAHPFSRLPFPPRSRPTCSPASRSYAASRGTRPISYVARGQGFPFTPEDPDALAEAVLALRGLGADGLRIMGNVGRAFYRKHLAMDEGVRHMEEAFESVVAVPARMLERTKVLGRVHRPERKES